MGIASRTGAHIRADNRRAHRHRFEQDHGTAQNGHRQITKWQRLDLHGPSGNPRKAACPENARGPKSTFLANLCSISGAQPAGVFAFCRHRLVLIPAHHPHPRFGAVVQDARQRPHEHMGIRVRFQGLRDYEGQHPRRPVSSVRGPAGRVFSVTDGFRAQLTCDPVVATSELAMKALRGNGSAASRVGLSPHQRFRYSPAARRCAHAAKTALFSDHGLFGVKANGPGRFSLCNLVFEKRADDRDIGPYLFEKRQLPPPHVVPRQYPAVQPFVRSICLPTGSGNPLPWILLQFF